MLLAIILILLAWGISIVTMEQVGYRSIIIGTEGQNSLFAKIVRGKNTGPMGIEPPGAISSDQPANPVLDQLTVSVTHDLLGSLHPVYRAMVNVSEAIVDSDNAPVEPGERSIYTPGGNASVLVTVVSGVTDARGTVNFRVPPGNYTVLVTDFGIVGSAPIFLTQSTPRVLLRWAFHDRLETPSFIQINDQNEDGVISPGEPIVLFYNGGSSSLPYQTRMVLNGRVDTSVDLRILEFNAYPHGIYLVATPLRPIRISDLNLDSEISVEATWYEVVITY